MNERKMNLTQQDRALVTVCMPAYNYGRYLDSAIQSIFDQTYRPIELIVVDDGSSDGSHEILERLRSTAPIPMKIIHSGHQGVAAAMNQGVQEAAGTWIAVAHADDISKPDRVEKLMKMATSSVSLIHSGYTNFYDSSELGQRDSSEVDLPPARGEALRGLLLHRLDVRSMTIMFSRNSCVEKGGFDETLPVEDWQLILKMADAGLIAYVDEPLVYRRIHSSNLSFTAHKKKAPISKADFAYSVLEEVIPPDLRFDQIAARHAAMVIRNSIAMGSWKRAAVGIRDVGKLFPNQRWLVVRLSSRGVMSFFWMKFRVLIPKSFLRRLI